MLKKREEFGQEEEPIEEPESDLFRGSVACGASGQITSVALELDKLHQRPDHLAGDAATFRS